MVSDRAARWAYTLLHEQVDVLAREQQGWSSHSDHCDVTGKIVEVDV